ncbi:hypothetical protein BDY17DRAFT_294264 [Neohortaea acidophila]|uniref:DUF1295-domain-containing protein n=1 Tax=Neohortaea acidophila TaxID=245834 RepID=A0A6A6Q0L7_9PEZI|nr:uncharacterized protein BDY17DRAFT_294264 [Neohortaea acidophila]KAF2485805.1 hypothetical protein BDY17DRAFT_294264 [Neohortaea acidophila]
MYGTVGQTLPAIQSLQDCADFSKTVLPHLRHFWESTLSRTSVQDLTNIEVYKQFYFSTNPLVTALVFSVALFPIFLLVSEVNRNYSQVDRVWSILPTVYNIHYAVWARLHHLPTKRLDNVLAFSVLWSLRLTFNYWRRGGYQIGSEDYRWMIIKKRIGGPAFTLLNILFISTTQILVLFAVTTPTYIILLTSLINPDLTWADAAISRTLIGLVVIEYFADQQQWNYQQAKKSYQATAKVPPNWTHGQMERGFVTAGLWSWSRHPNFAAEQTIWFLLYVWGCARSETYINWTLPGALVYLAIFQGSTPLTEGVSRGKYPEYKFYQERVGRFYPNIFGPGWDDGEMETLAKKLLEKEKRLQGKAT